MHLSLTRIAGAAIVILGLVVAASGFLSFDLVGGAFGVVLIGMGLALEFANRRHEKLKSESEALRSAQKGGSVCPSCGSRLQGNSQYCSKCKTPIKQIA